MSKRLMALLSIVERDKGKKLIKELENFNIRLNMQFVGFGTAPTEMLDIFGLGTKDKDIVISIGSENVVKELMANFGEAFESHAKYGGIMVVLNISAANRILTELLNYNNPSSNNEKGTGTMKNEHHNNLILISVKEGYSEEVMHVARKAGATGGTVIKGRLADNDLLSEIADTGIDGDREILCILAPLGTSKQIMEDVNKEYGTTSKANGIIVAIPTEKAYKI